MYHEITDNTRESGFQTSGAELWKHSVNDFKRDMSIILVKKALIKLITEIDIKKNNKYIFLTFYTFFELNHLLNKNQFLNFCVIL